MLTFKKVLTAFKGYLEEDDRYIIETLSCICCSLLPLTTVISMV